MFDTKCNGSNFFKASEQGRTQTWMTYLPNKTSLNEESMPYYVNAILYVYSTAVLSYYCGNV